MVPYFRPEDIPEPMCDGSFEDLSWEGHWEDPNRPTEYICSKSGAHLKLDFEEFIIEEEKDLIFACIPMHYPGEPPN